MIGEAVGLDLRLARLPSRLLAFAVDAAVSLGALLALSILTLRLLSGANEAFAATITLVLTVAVLVGYPVLSETLTRGRTLGKAALGLRVVRDDGGPLRFRQALLRGLLAFFVDVWTTLGVVGVVTAALSQRGKRVGDVLAGTVVVRDRAPGAASAAPPMPPYLIPWAQSADLSRVGDDLALAARQVLARGGELDRAAFADLTTRLATSVAAVVAPPPPPGTPAWHYLAAVLAERRRREELRLATQPSYAAPPPAALEPAAPPPRDPGAGGFALPG